MFSNSRLHVTDKGVITAVETALAFTAVAMTSYPLVVAHLAASLVFTYVVISGCEYILHRHLMHTMWIAKRLGQRKLCLGHMAVHHRTYAKQFKHELGDHADDSEIPLKFTLAFAVPLTVLVFFVDPLTAAVLFAGALAHNWLWNTVHCDMHQSHTCFLSETRLYRFWESYHVVHHHHADKNYNGIAPLFDWLCGTYSAPHSH